MAQHFEQFGKYILLEKIASGGMAEVYLAKSIGASGVNKFVAVKRILPQFSENQEFIDMFKEEAKIAVNLQNSNIVQIFDFGVERAQFFLVMEYVEGKNLRQINNEFKKLNLHFSIDQIVFMAKEVSAGLDHAHRCIDGATGKPLNITHRDMSPQNVMISYEGEVKIIDFGIAKAETQMQETKAGTLKGKFGYMSPEQAEGQNIDLRTDIFSLGIVLWELLANDRLFTASSEAAILRKIRDCQIPNIRKMNPSVPQELERIVAKALAKDRSLRYQTGTALHRDLNRFLNTQYPEFSPHDFSIFIKNAFSQQVIDVKKKLVDYAKVTLNIVEVPPNAHPIFNTQAGAQGGGDHDKISSPLDDLGSLNLSPNHEVPSDLNFEPKKNIRRPNPNPENFDSVVRKTNTNITRHQTRTSRSKQTDISQVSLAGTMKIIAGVAALVVGLWITVGPGKGKVAPIVTIIAQGFAKFLSPVEPVATPIPSGIVRIGSEQKVTLTIQSVPSGARIFVDGIEQENQTPRSIILGANSNYKIELRKDGFISYETHYHSKQEPGSIIATMLPIAKQAYVSINVINGGERPIITVNGVRLSETPPIALYAIPAETPVTIKAYNPFTRLSAETTIRVQANKKKSIDLILDSKSNNN